MERYNFLSRPRVVRITRDALIATVAVGAAIGVSHAALVDAVNPANALSSIKLFINPSSPAKKQADSWRGSRPTDAALMQRLASQPMATWINGWATDVRGAVAKFVKSAASQGATPVFVAYNIPNRDCGSYSAGGVKNADAYRSWIRQFAAGLGGGKTVVVLEPDAIAGASCLSQAGREERYALLSDAVQVLKAANATVYLDGGNSKWLAPNEIAARLGKAGIAQADGFSLNVSNYQTTNSSVAYGDQVSRLVGGKHYIVDTSRNGVGGRGSEWCNVRGQALGEAPTTNTGRALVDAFLWIKIPGESDGTCNGGPRSGQWWPEYALELARNDASGSTAN